MRITEKDGEFYELKPEAEVYGWENGIRLVQIVGKYEDLKEELGCSLEEMIELIKLLKKYYYVEITGKLVARTIWNNTELSEKELYKINHIFNKIKDKSE